MKLYSSRVPNTDPFPYVDPEAGRWYAEEGVCWPESGPYAGQIHEWSNTLWFSPRPEYNHVPAATEGANPGLLYLREQLKEAGEANKRPLISIHARMTEWDLIEHQTGWRHFTAETVSHLEHLHKVLSRLAALES